MKIIMPILNRSTIADGFHNADDACIYDSETRTYEYVPTASISKVAGNLSLELKRKGITAVLSNLMPAMALQLFVDSGLKVYKTIGNDVYENVYYFTSNVLQPITRPVNKGSDCSGSCSSCGTFCS